MNPAAAGELVSKAGLKRSMMKNKRRLMRSDEEQLPCKRTRPSLDMTSVARSSKSRKGALSAQVVTRLRKAVVALASFDGDTKLRECTGICIETSCSDATILTSRQLVPPTWPASLRIKVRLPNNRIVTGWIEDPGIYVGFFIVNIKKVSGFAAAHVSLDCDMQFEPYRKVAAVCRHFSSGYISYTTGVELASPSAHIDEKMLSTCWIRKVGIGGPLVDFDGNFVGMNCSRTRKRKTPYVQRLSILQFLHIHRMVSGKEGVEDAAGAFIKCQMKEPFVRSRGAGIYINRLEAPFDEDIWMEPFIDVPLEMYQSLYLWKENAAPVASESSKHLASKMKRSVVSLASFNGFANFFACTGVFIKCNARSATILTSASLVRVSGDAHMIDDNLRVVTANFYLLLFAFSFQILVNISVSLQIEVCLPNQFRVVGILNRYNLHYNVALVDIMGYWGGREIEICAHQATSSMDVIAVGSLFARHRLMAVEGKVLIGKQSKLDCKQLCVSTCKITKAGIGGPLIDTDGNFVGMNFYDEEETPFLPRDVIHRLLLNVNKERTSADDTVMEGDENRWLLPGGTHRNTDTTAEGGGNKWPLPKPRLVGVKGGMPLHDFLF